MLYESISPDYADMGFRPRKFRNSEDALAFHLPPYTSTIISKPGTSAIRGGRKDMYYDEAAFIKEFIKLWQAGLPAITRGEGRVTVVSTPMGQSGLYYDLWKEPSFSHHIIPWWESRFMVLGAEEAARPYDVVAEAIAICPTLDTETRLDRFGTKKIKDIFHVGLRGDIVGFQTEYECMFVDEADAYFPYDLVLACSDKGLRIYKEYPEGYDPIGDISIGVDLAKERDSTVFTVVEHIDVGGKNHHFVRFVYATQADYDDQFKMLQKLVTRTHARRVSIDATGPGQMFAEKARKNGFGQPCNIEAINFTNTKKEHWATTFKGDLQLGTISYPKHPELIAQIHGIKRTKTENNFFKFSGVKDDYFWSLMLGLYGEGYRPTTFHMIGSAR